MTRRRRTVQLILIAFGLLLSLPACWEHGGAAGRDAGPGSDGDVDTDTGTDTDSEPVMYGPAGCASDAQCAEQLGAGWYCDTDFVTDTESGATWPTCVEDTDDDAGADSGSGGPVYYGPAECTGTAADSVPGAERWYGDSPRRG